MSLSLRSVPIATAAGLAIITLAAWAALLAGLPMTDPATFLVAWIVMMAAMMLPSVAPMVLLFDRVSAEKARRDLPYVPTWIFAASYFAVWTVYGLAAFGLYRGVRALDIGFLNWDRGGPYVAGALVALAGLYELTPLKGVCMRHCRSPMQFVLAGWRDGVSGALRMGAEHGAYCVGCCWGLMVVLFALGVMSLFWMAVVAALIFAQKVLPYGDRLSRVFAVAFVAFGIWLAAAPGTVPGLTQPGTMHAPKMQMTP